MSLLGLWELSIGLAVASLLIMMGLIAARIVSERREGRAAARRAILLPKLLSGEADLSHVLRGFASDGQSTDLIVELIAMVRGPERDRFVALASELGARDDLLRRLSKGSVRLKIGAAEALSFFPDALATDALDKALDDDAGEVRLSAALSLAKSDRAPPIRVLVERLSLTKSENSLLLISILQWIASEHPEEVESLLADDLVDPVVKAAGIDALAALGNFHAAPLINGLALAADEENEILARYLRALGTLRHPAGKPAALHYLGSATWWIRAAAAEAAGKIGVTEAIGKLDHLLGDPDWWVRFRAGEALAQLGTPGIEALRAAARSLSSDRQEAGALTLAELGIARDE